MNKTFREQMYNELNLKETEDLIKIWQTNDHGEWSDTAFEVIKEILIQRLGEIPSQEEIVNENEEGESVEEDQLEDWEAKLLDDENQPELYDTLEVLKLRDNINKVAIGVIIAYGLLGLLNLQFVQSLLRGIPMSFSEILQSLPNEIYPVLITGLQIAITYFPLKALAQILRILMEMEFRSRKGI